MKSIMFNESQQVLRKTSVYVFVLLLIERHEYLCYASGREAEIRFRDRSKLLILVPLQYVDVASGRIYGRYTW